MSVQAFRRPRSRWRLLPWVVVGACAAGIGLARNESDPDPQMMRVPAGAYEVVDVTVDAAVVIAIPHERTNHRLRVNLLGVSIPHSHEAAIRLRELLGTESVRIRFDRRRLDRNGELLAYVYVGDLMLNEELVREGLARDATHPSDSGPIVRRIKKAEHAALLAARGIWAAAPPQ